MPDADPTNGLVACAECGAPHHVDDLESGGSDGERCPHCGNDSFSGLRDPSGM